ESWGETAIFGPMPGASYRIIPIDEFSYEVGGRTKCQPAYHNRFSVNGGGRKLDRDPEAARAARWPWAAAQRVLTPTLSLTDQLRPDRAVRSTLIFVLTCTAALTR